MKKTVLAFIAGLIAWILVVSLLNRGLRSFVDGYAAAEPQMAFTLGMMVSRLTIGAVTSLITGAIMGAIAPASSRTPWALGVLLLAGFIPEHIHVWHRFPLWYHLTFLLTLLPLIVLGARLVKPLTIARRSGADEDAVPSR